MERTARVLTLRLAHLLLGGVLLGGVLLGGVLLTGCAASLRMPEALRAQPRPLRLQASGDPWSGGVFRLGVEGFVAEARLAGPRPPSASLTSGRWRSGGFTLAMTEAGLQPRTAGCSFRMRDGQTELSCTLTDGARNLVPLATLEASFSRDSEGVLGTLAHHDGAGVRTLTLRRDEEGRPGTFVFFEGETPVAALQLSGVLALWLREGASPEERWALAAATAMLGCEAHLRPFYADVGPSFGVGQP